MQSILFKYLFKKNPIYLKVLQQTTGVWVLVQYTHSKVRIYMSLFQNLILLR